MYRISRNGQEPIVEVDTLDEIYAVFWRAEPGRYRVDVISAGPPPCARTSRRLGIGIKRPDGLVVIEPDPSP
jgi:hypothetical protein